MSNNSYVFTSESVSMGHPDKMADQISDAILDAMLSEDATSRVACETMVTTGLAVIAGEVTCDGYVDIAAIVRDVIRDIGYTDSAMGFDADSCAVMVTLDKQSPDIAQGVDTGRGLHAAQGAGDQGLMFGFACRETESLMPLPIDLSHRLMARHADVRSKDIIPHLRPDAKAQVSVEYDGLTPTQVKTVVLSSQHGPEWTERHADLTSETVSHIIKPVLGDWWHDDIDVLVNPTGKFEVGGPLGDCGLTGRKIIVDTYGGRGRHGGGAFSGKDPSKVDRSAAYMARYVAKNVVAAGLADACEVQLSYAIGVAKPTSVHVDCQGTAHVPESAIRDAIEQTFDMTPAGIITSLGLLRPIYKPTAAHGHFGRTPDECVPGSFSWERTDKAETLKKAAALDTAGV
ncbi:MAG: methionine adenosyltransferase [Phycisphaerales bacterium]|jgi:S-adenosylmethionine synthetase|nr:methionine adenosyltransferase [Phycisphaerales bacterium]